MQVIVADRGALNYMSGLGSNQASLDYFRQNYEKVNRYLGNANNAFKSSVSNIYNNFISSEAISRAKQTISKLDLGAGFNDTIVHYVQDPRLARGVMRDYIMANPKVDELFRRNILEGYATTDYQHSKIPLEYRKEYQEVMDGIVEDDGTSVSYCDSTEDWISIHEQQAVRRTWDQVSIMINNDEDPTASTL